MNMIQCCIFFLLCLVNWVHGKNGGLIDLHIMAMIFNIKAQCQDGNVRLTGGPNELEGRVELCVDGNWGQVCAMMWTRDDAQVVCRQLGHSTVNRELLTMYGTYVLLQYTH